MLAVSVLSVSAPIREVSVHLESETEITPPVGIAVGSSTVLVSMITGALTENPVPVTAVTSLMPLTLRNLPSRPEILTIAPTAMSLAEGDSPVTMVKDTKEPPAAVEDATLAVIGL